MATKIDSILDRFESVLQGNPLPVRDKHFSRYAITNFRGGIGKSTLAFNIAWEISRRQRMLFVDLCSQRNFSQTLLGDDLSDCGTTIYDALLAEVFSSGDIDAFEMLVSVKPYCPSFKGGKDAFLIPGSNELFLFPSILYGQLATHSQIGDRGKSASARLLKAVSNILNKVDDVAKPEVTLIDTSPFFGGATHLGWMAAEALIIPVRVDQHSMDALDLTLSMLDNKKMDFLRFNEQAGISHSPKVHAIAMTHCGWNRRRANTPDNSTKYFLGKTVEIAEKYSHHFSSNNVLDCIYILDDFLSSGRISGTRRIPLFQLQAGQQYVVDAQRLEVNPSVERYKKELYALTAAL